MLNMSKELKVFIKKIWAVLTGNASNKYEWLMVLGVFLQLMPLQAKFFPIATFDLFVMKLSISLFSFPASLGPPIFCWGLWKSSCKRVATVELKKV